MTTFNRKGAIKSTLSAASGAAELVDLAIEIAIVNLRVTLQEELMEAEAAQAKLLAQRQAIAESTEG